MQVKTTCLFLTFLSLVLVFGLTATGSAAPKADLGFVLSLYDDGIVGGANGEITFDEGFKLGLGYIEEGPIHLDTVGVKFGIRSGFQTSLVSLSAAGDHLGFTAGDEILGLGAGVFLDSGRLGDYGYTADLNVAALDGKWLTTGKAMTKLYMGSNIYCDLGVNYFGAGNQNQFRGFVGGGIEF
jgi:hypothetical protein